MKTKEKLLNIVLESYVLYNNIQNLREKENKLI